MLLNQMKILYVLDLLFYESCEILWYYFIYNNEKENTKINIFWTVSFLSQLFWILLYDFVDNKSYKRPKWSMTKILCNLWPQTSISIKIYLSIFSTTKKIKYSLTVCLFTNHLLLSFYYKFMNKDDGLKKADDVDDDVIATIPTMRMLWIIWRWNCCLMTSWHFNVPKNVVIKHKTKKSTLTLSKKLYRTDTSKLKQKPLK